MKRVVRQSITLLFAGFMIAVAYSQPYARFIDRLTTTGGNATVRVTLDRQSTAALSQLPLSSSLYGFRICLYSGSDQNARSMASGAVARLKTSFPSISSKMEYDSPVFKVFGGACLTRAEAAVLLAMLRGSFPSAFIKADRLSINELTDIPSLGMPDSTALGSVSIISEF